MDDGTTLETIGTQRVTAWGVVLFAASALLTGACTWHQFGPALGLLIGLAGVGGAIRWYSGRGQPCFTVEHEALVHHFGGRSKRYAWTGMRRPVRLKRKLLQDFLEVRREKGVPLLIPVDDLKPRERKRLLAIVTEIVCSGATGEEATAQRPEDVVASSP